MILELGMKACGFWKYYFQLINYENFMNLDKLDILRYQLPADKQ
jgi:hypothetical protein